MRARGEGGIGFEYARILALKTPSILGFFIYFYLVSYPMQKLKNFCPVAGFTEQSKNTHRSRGQVGVE